MDKCKALAILQSIYKDISGEWRIPRKYKYCKREVTLSNGEKATFTMEDEVYDFITYVKKLIENTKEN